MHNRRQTKAKKRLIGAVLAVGVALALTTGGCSDSDDGGPDPTPTATAEVEVTPTPTLPPPGSPGAGLVTTIDAIEISEAGVVTATFTLTDEAGAPIEPSLSSVDSDDLARVRFALAHLENYSGGGDLGTEFSRYVNEVNATDPGYDSGGTLEAVDAAAGVHRYTFATQLAAGFDRSRTYSVGMQVDRDFEGVELSANPVADIVPDGGEPQIRAGTTTAQCNNCHDPLRLHGNRREVRLCAMCHTEAAVDSKGNSIDLRVMIHKIHRGVDLPSVADGEPGDFYGIYSDRSEAYIKYAEKLEDGTVVGVAFPRPLQDCDSCHSGGPTSADHTTKASTAACAACHDDVNPSETANAAGPPGTGHFQDRGFPDGQCALCHNAGGDVEFDVSVLGAHTVPEQSAQLAGLNAEITAASGAPGQAPMVSFKLTEGDGTVLRDLSGFNRVAFAMSGPTSDYGVLFAPTAVGGGASGTLAGPDAEGVFSYTLPAPLPADASGTWAIGLEARRSVMLAAPEGEDVAVNEAPANPVVTFQVGSGSAEVRRMVVDDLNCQSCHGEFSRGFSIHGNLRNRIEYCVVCHNPNQTDVSRRSRDPEAVAAGDQTATIDFKVMIHKIHTGEELNQKPYLIYGFGPAPENYTVHDFAEVLYPGDRTNCAGCHVDDSQLLPPFPGQALGPVIAHLDPATGMQIIDGRAGPIGAACTSCHDSDAAQAHVDTQTAPDGGEACEVCHSEGRDVPVSEAHASAE